MQRSPHRIGSLHTAEAVRLQSHDMFRLARPGFVHADCQIKFLQMFWTCLSPKRSQSLPCRCSGHASAQSALKVSPELLAAHKKQCETVDTSNKLLPDNREAIQSAARELDFELDDVDGDCGYQDVHDWVESQARIFGESQNEAP